MQKRRTRIVLVSIAALSLFAAGARAAQDGGKAEDGAQGEEVAPGLHVGDMLDQSNWQLAKDLLPSEILRHYKDGEYKNVIVSYPVGQAHWEKSFLEATEKNAGQLDIDERGSVVYSSTKKQPAYLYGIPFPNIDPERSEGGLEGGVEPVPRLLVRRQQLQPDSGGDAAGEGNGPRDSRQRLVRVLGRPDRRSTARTTRSICRVSSSASRPTRPICRAPRR